MAEYDIIVAGGGVGGTAAALAASASGKKTLLIEKQTSLGGVGTNGLVPSFAPFSKMGFSFGLIPDLIFSSYKRYAGIDENSFSWTPVYAESLKYTLDRLTDEFGVDVLFGAEISDIKHKNGKILAVKACGKCFEAETFIDGTTDAAVAEAAGCDFIKTEVRQPSTLCFTLANVDEALFIAEGNIQNDNPDSPVFKMIEDDELPLITYPHLCVNGIRNGVVGFNAGYIFAGDSAFERSGAIKKGRELAAQYLKGLKKYCKAYGRAELIQTAPLLGVRESKSVAGERVLTVDSYIGRIKHDDYVAVNNYFVDLHSKELADEHIKNKSGGVFLYDHYKPGEYYTVPLGCLIPKNIDNLLIASKNICCDRHMQASVRVMPSVMGIGAAAGTAAAICAGGDPRTANPKAIRQICFEDKISGVQG